MLCKYNGRSINKIHGIHRLIESISMGRSNLNSLNHECTYIHLSQLGLQIWVRHTDQSKNLSITQSLFVGSTPNSHIIKLAVQKFRDGYVEIFSMEADKNCPYRSGQVACCYAPLFWSHDLLSCRGLLCSQQSETAD